MAAEPERVYLDSSIVLALLLREKGGRLKLARSQEPITSEVTELECRRTLDRIRIEERLGDDELAARLAELRALLAATRQIRIGGPVLRRAMAPFPTVVRSLDAIHLASAELGGARLFLSRDRQQLAAARALGMRAGETSL